jgi:tryptophan synthase alpha chain
VAARAVSELADAVVVGSRIIEEIENSTRSALLDNVNDLVKSLRAALDEVNSANSSQIVNAGKL